MADAEQAESPASSPGSNAGAQSGLKASKDRQCPFCGQAFTSSSLGRHLDLYIKPKNPKPPDGVHDVDEIRRLRSMITRRQPRTGTKAAAGSGAGAGAGGSRDSLGKRESGAWSQAPEDRLQRSEGAATGDNDSVGSSSAPQDPRPRDDQQPLVFAKWQATGVINDLPARRYNEEPRPRAGRDLPEVHRESSGNRVQRPDYETESMWKLQEQAEVGRAAEMALREVMGSLEAAKNRAEVPLIFEDIDVFSLSFPGLCLALLPPPPTLFTASPFPATHAWFLDPPGRREFEAMNRAISERLQVIKEKIPETIPDSSVFKHYAHIQGAFEHWQSISEAEQREAWKLEMMRAFVREREHSEKTRKDLDHALARVRHLELEYDRLSRCQLPRDYLLHPPNTLAIPPAVQRQVQTGNWKSGVAEANYDADALIDKWRTTVKSMVRNPRPSAQSQSQTQTPTVQYETVYSEPRRGELKADMVMNGSVWTVNGPVARTSDNNNNSTSRLSEAPTTSYRTPNEPGTIIDIDDERSSSNVGPERKQSGTPVDRTALSKFRNETGETWYGGSGTTGDFNANGKRPLTPNTAVFARTAKMYKEQ